MQAYRRVVLLLGLTLAVSGFAPRVAEADELPEPAPQASAAYQRFRDGKVRYEAYNEFHTQFKYAEIEGFAFDEGVESYYPSSVIQVDDLYYMWYSKPPSDAKVVGPNQATDSFRAFHWDLCEVWYATSKDGYQWEEQGVAIRRGAKGRYDHRSVFNPDVLVAGGKYYLVYQAAASLADARWAKTFPTAGDFAPNTLGMAVADSPRGPWRPFDEPVLKPGPANAWDGDVVHEPTFFVKGGRYFLYYKSDGRLPWEANVSPGAFNKEHADMPLATGVAIADRPEGPYVKSKQNPVLMGGHGSMVWPYRNGVCATLPEGPDRNSILFADDGINFHPRIQGLTVPKGGGCFRPGGFTDVDVRPGQGVTWGLCHVLSPRYHFVRFECDLSLQKGDQVRKRYEMVRNYQSGEGYEYDPRLGAAP